MVSDDTEGLKWTIYLLSSYTYLILIKYNKTRPRFKLWVLDLVKFNISHFVVNEKILLTNYDLSIVKKTNWFKNMIYDHE